MSDEFKFKRNETTRAYDRGLKFWYLLVLGLSFAPLILIDIQLYHLAFAVSPIIPTWQILHNGDYNDKQRRVISLFGPVFVWGIYLLLRTGSYIVQIYYK